MIIHRHTYQNRTQKCIPINSQPIYVVDVIMSRLEKRDIDKLFHGTGIFQHDLYQSDVLISIEQWLKLISNAQSIYNQADLAFLIGNRLWPGHYSKIANILPYSQNLDQALKLFCQHKAELSPLAHPSLFVDDDYIYIQWLDSYGLSELTDFVMEMTMSGFSSWLKHSCGESWPWQFYFKHKQVKHREAQYEVNFKGQAHFSAPMNAMVLPIEYLYTPWPKSSPSLLDVNMAHVKSNDAGPKVGFLYKVHEVIQENICKDTRLDAMAAQFAMSPTTFKRKLKAHKTHYKHLHDQVRLNTALYLFRSRNWGNSEVASYLQFKDTANFRRAFKRWCGSAPQDIKLQPWGALFKV
ncbi:AraC family transcriptional regulator ligand-binding domain-containing protein [Bermanella sp. R86510]|uniref:AraC family transcriptional regulator n=1 Tax=unclassified Bermanella TaxID=2627862 RepID=UPI0037C8BD00